MDVTIREIRDEITFMQGALQDDGQIAKYGIQRCPQMSEHLFAPRGRKDWDCRFHLKQRKLLRLAAGPAEMRLPPFLKVKVPFLILVR